MRSIWALGLALGAAAAAQPPHLRAVRVESAPHLDGMLDGAAWAQAAPTEAFTQKFPVEGAAPTERTTLRVLYDASDLYVEFECDQRREPVVAHLTRRDRQVESDWVSVGIGTRRDGKSAFEFTVSAAGVQSDTLRYNDTDTSPEWDENWDARVTRTATGWTAELRIPLRILRYDSAPEQSWDFQARRYVSALHETDEWSFIPRDSAGEVSHYGKLDGLGHLERPPSFELRPFALGRVRRRDASDVTVGRGTDLAASIGLDLKWHPSQAATVDVALNPDFAQVDPDQLVLNLTQFETYFPEQRPFFLEGLDAYATPMQLLYTRRIGRVPELPELRGDVPEALVDYAQPTPILGAAKVTGRVADRWTVGVLQALTGENAVPVQQADGSRAPRLLDPLTSYSVLRVKRDVGLNGEIGAMATSVLHFEPATGYPIAAADPADPQATQLCPSGVRVRPGSRCFNDAYVAGLDWRWRSDDGSWVTGGQAAGSMLGHGPPRRVRDGTVIHPGDVGAGALAYLKKEGGGHWVGNASVELDDPKLDLNDLGYARRANSLSWGADLEWRNLERWGPFLETHARAEYFDELNLKGLDLGSGYQLNVSGKTAGFWELFTEVHYRPDRFDDREVGDGTALERAGLLGYELEISSNRSDWVSFQLGTQLQFLSGGFHGLAEGGVLVRALPQLDVDILPYVQLASGEPRFVAPGAQPGEYLFGKLDAKGVGATVRATYTFTPRLTLQAYAQLFLSSEHFSEFSSFLADASPTPSVVHLAELRPAAAPSFNPDKLEGALNVNVVLRWEFLLGSTLFLVYTHSQAPTAPLAFGRAATLDLGAVRQAPAADAFLLKLSYWLG